MKLVMLLGLISMMVAYSLAQGMMGPAMGTQQQSGQSPNFLQMMLMRNMLDMNWLPIMYYMSAMNGMGGGMGGMGAGAGGSSIYPLLFMGNM